MFLVATIFNLIIPKIASKTTFDDPIIELKIICAHFSDNPRRIPLWKFPSPPLSNGEENCEKQKRIFITKGWHFHWLVCCFQKNNESLFSFVEIENLYLMKSKVAQAHAIFSLAFVNYFLKNFVVDENFFLSAPPFFAFKTSVNLNSTRVTVFKEKIMIIKFFLAFLLPLPLTLAFFQFCCG